MLELLADVLITCVPGFAAAWGLEKIGIIPSNNSTGIGWNLKTVILIACCVAGAFLLIFLGRILGIKLFKKRR